MGIVDSKYIIEQTPQADGRSWVKEIHTDHNGVKHYAEYLASPDFDYETCLTKRAETIGAEIDRKDAATAEGAQGVNYRKIRQDAFLDRFSFTEQLKIQQSEDPVVKVFVQNAIMVQRPYINLDHAMVQQALPYLVQTSILDGDTEQDRQSRMAEILANGTITEI